MTDLEEKQEKYEYRTADDLYTHLPPVSETVVKGWNERLKAIGGTDRFGDARLRVVWAGTERKRGYIQTPNGSEAGFVIKYPAQVPHVQKLLGYRYKNGKGETVFTKRHDTIPQGIYVESVVEQEQLGQLRWALERKQTPEELVLLGFYPSPNSPQAKTFGVDLKTGRRYIAPMDARGEYLKLFVLETPDGKYFEPTREWLDFLQARQFEVDNADKAEQQRIFAATLELEEKQEQSLAAYKEEQANTIFEETLIEVEKAPRGRVRSFGK